LNSIAQIRQSIGGEVFDYQVLLHALAGYRKPRDRITRLLANGAIVRIKKGLYCFGEAFRKEPLTPERLQHLLRQAVDDLDVEQARREVVPFVVDQRALDVWSRDFFRQIIPRMVSI